MKRGRMKKKSNNSNGKRNEVNSFCIFNSKFVFIKLQYFILNKLIKNNKIFLIRINEINKKNYNLTFSKNNCILIFIKISAPITIKFKIY